MKATRRRASQPKSRTGCSTCKARHVKCDETKPACRQCTRTGRQCDGYEQQRASQRDLLERSLASYGQRAGSSSAATVSRGTSVRAGATASASTSAGASASARASAGATTAVARSNPTSDCRIILRQGTREEREHVYMFCTQTSRALSGFIPSDFWERLLPQLSECEPIVRHAAAAVGAVHRQYLTLDVENGITVGPFILQQYNSAIRKLVQNLAAPAQTGTSMSEQQLKHQRLHLPLITCSLFVCLELLRGNFEQGLNHLEAGLNILIQRQQQQQQQQLLQQLQQQQQQPQPPPPQPQPQPQPEPEPEPQQRVLPSPPSSAASPASSPSPPPQAPSSPSSSSSSSSPSQQSPRSESEVIDIELSDLFARFNIELSLSGRPPLPMPEDPATQNPQNGFVDMADARRHMTTLMGKSMEVIRDLAGPQTTQVDDPAASESDRPDPEARLGSLKAQFDAWTDSLDRLVQSDQGKSTIDPRAPLALRLDHRLAVIWALSALRKQEIEFDRFNDDFAAIVQFAGDLLHLDRKSTSSSFYTDPAVIRPLHWTATKCRNPTTRREALRLMSTFARKESMWGWRRSFEIGNVVMVHEEAALEHLPVELRVPEDHQRVYESSFADDPEARHSTITMWTKPQGPDGEMQSSVVTVPWDSPAEGGNFLPGYSVFFEKYRHGQARKS